MLISLVTYIDRYRSLRTIVTTQFTSKVKYKEIYLRQIRALTIQTYKSLLRLIYLGYLVTKYSNLPNLYLVYLAFQNSDYTE